MFLDLVSVNQSGLSGDVEVNQAVNKQNDAKDEHGHVEDCHLGFERGWVRSLHHVPVLYEQDLDCDQVLGVLGARLKNDY